MTSLILSVACLYGFGIWCLAMSALKAYRIWKYSQLQKRHMDLITHYVNLGIYFSVQERERQVKRDLERGIKGRFN